MRILHLLSQTHLTGPEVYAAMLCGEQIAVGHHCTIASDTLSVKTEADYIPMAIHNRSLINRVNNIVTLLRLCHEKEIDLIHALSRAASWIAIIVCRITRIGYVSTVHGNQSRRAIRSSFNIYGRDIIVVCEHLADHLRKEMKIGPADIRVIRNGIE